MIRESVVDSVFNRLSEGLGGALVVRPPATIEELRILERLVGPLPRELSIYLLTCNGCRIQVERHDRRWALWSTHEMVEALRAPSAASAPRCLIPIRGDDPGDRDWVVTGHDPVGGLVVRWDPWDYGAALLASCFGSYLHAWGEYALRGLRVRGSTACVCDPLPPFDAEFIGKLDPRLDNLMRNEEVRQSLAELGAVAAAGDDLE